MVVTPSLPTRPADIEPEKAFARLHEGRHRLAPVVDSAGRLTGMLTRTGALRATLYEPATDAAGRLRIAAAAGVNGDVVGKAAAPAEAGRDLIVVDSANGHPDKMIAALTAIL